MSWSNVFWFVYDDAAAAIDAFVVVIAVVLLNFFQTDYVELSSNLWATICLW